MYILHIKLSFQVCIRLLSLTLQTGRTQPEIHMYVHVYLHLLIYMYIVFVHDFLIIMFKAIPVFHNSCTTHEEQGRPGTTYTCACTCTCVHCSHGHHQERVILLTILLCSIFMYIYIYIYIYRLYHAVEVVS